MNDTITAAAAQASDLIKGSCSAVAKGAQDYNSKIIEFAQTNINATFAFMHQLAGVRSPSELMELSTAHAQRQFETVTAQTRELAALAQNVALATAEPLKTGVTKAFSSAA